MPRPQRRTRPGAGVDRQAHESGEKLDAWAGFLDSAKGFLAPSRILEQLNK
jgi:hypothetical protein